VPASSLRFLQLKHFGLFHRRLWSLINATNLSNSSDELFWIIFMERITGMYIHSGIITLNMINNLLRLCCIGIKSFAVSDLVVGLNIMNLWVISWLLNYKKPLFFAGQNSDYFYHLFSIGKRNVCYKNYILWTDAWTFFVTNPHLLLRMLTVSLIKWVNTWPPPLSFWISFRIISVCAS